MSGCDGTAENVIVVLLSTISTSESTDLIEQLARAAETIKKTTNNFWEKL